MSGLIESYKKVYENKKAHIWLVTISIIWTLLSALWDIKTGNPDNYRQNPLDIIFNIIIGAYSLQFLHNAINNTDNGVLPSFMKICPKIYLGIIKLNIIWGIYAVLVLVSAVLLYIATHFIAVPVIITVLLLFFAMFVYYIFLAYAEDLNSKGLVNIALLFKFIKPGFKPLYIKLLLFVMFSGNLHIVIYCCRAHRIRQNRAYCRRFLFYGYYYEYHSRIFCYCNMVFCISLFINQFLRQKHKTAYQKG